MFPQPIRLPLPAGQLCCLRLWAEASPDRKLTSGHSHTGKPLPDPTQTDTYPPPSPPSPTSQPPTPCVFSPQLSSASPVLIGSTVAQSPHLLVEIGWRLFPFLDGQGQGTLGYRVLTSHSTCSEAAAMDYESQLVCTHHPLYLQACSNVSTEG